VFPIEHEPSGSRRALEGVALQNSLLPVSWRVRIEPTRAVGSDYGLGEMAQDRSSAPREASKRSEISDLHEELPALLRGLVDDMQALCELAAVVDELRAQVLRASAPPFIEAVPWLPRQPGRNPTTIH
jgi:hypothetical protein